MTTNELKPCPFCGGKAKHVYFRFTDCHSIWCKNCGAEVYEFDTEEEAIEAWNTRAERTCKYIWDANRHVWFCSVCGGLKPCSDSVNYCCDCGAKVVQE